MDPKEREIDEEREDDESNDTVYEVPVHVLL